MSYTFAELDNIIGTGESSTLELKQSIKDPLVLARLIAAFANADGGQIMIGIREPSTVVGVDKNLVAQMYQQAVSQLHPTPNNEIDFFSMDSKDIAVVTVEKSGTLVLSKDGAFIRVGAEVRAMFPQEIERALGSVALAMTEGSSNRMTDAPPTYSGSINAVLPSVTGNITGIVSPPLDIAGALADLTNMIQELQKQLQNANSFQAKAENYIVGGIVGAILGWLFSAAIGNLLGM